MNAMLALCTSALVLCFLEHTSALSPLPQDLTSASSTEPRPNRRQDASIVTTTITQTVTTTATSYLSLPTLESEYSEEQNLTIYQIETMEILEDDPFPDLAPDIVFPEIPLPPTDFPWYTLTSSSDSPSQTDSSPEDVDDPSFTTPDISVSIPSITISPLAIPSTTSSPAEVNLAPANSKFIFPVKSYFSNWTTATGFYGTLPLSDATLRPKNKLAGVTYKYIGAPDGKKSLRAYFPKGSYKPSASPRGGLSFYAPGPTRVKLNTAKEATFAYGVYFPKGFNFNKGGKLPGLYGGNNENVALSCSGGRRDGACFSVRLMWRRNGDGELYTYLPPYDIPAFSANKKLCDLPNSDCNPIYGTSVLRGSFKFKTGAWTTISQRVKLNDVGKENGELQLFVEGKSIMNIEGLVLRDRNAGRIRGIQMQTFFGGSNSDWASPKNQYVYFNALSAGITKKI